VLSSLFLAADMRCNCTTARQAPQMLSAVVRSRLLSAQEQGADATA
jgi:hypothetical protein